MTSSHACPSCGAAQPEGYRFCTSCGKPLPAPGEATPGVTPAPATGMRPEASRRIGGIGVLPATPDAGLDGITLATGERVQRAYTLSPRTRPLGSTQGSLVVTDQRIVYRAEARTRVGRSARLQEVQLRDVNGVSLDARRGMSARDLSSWIAATAVWFFLLPWIGTQLVSNGSSSYDRYYGTSSSNTSGWTVLFVLTWLAASALSFWLKWRSRDIDLVVRGRRGETVAVAMQGAIAKNTLGSVLARLRSPGTNLLHSLGIVDADMAAVGVDLDSAQALYGELGALILDLQTRQRAAGAVD